MTYYASNGNSVDFFVQINLALKTNSVHNQSMLFGESETDDFRHFMECDDFWGNFLLATTLYTFATACWRSGTDPRDTVRPAKKRSRLLRSLSELLCEVAVFCYCSSLMSRDVDDHMILGLRVC